jgi:hypothetical protein
MVQYVNYFAILKITDIGIRCREYTSSVLHRYLFVCAGRITCYRRKVQTITTSTFYVLYQLIQRDASYWQNNEVSFELHAIKFSA